MLNNEKTSEPGGDILNLLDPENETILSFPDYLLDIELPNMLGIRDIEDEKARFITSFPVGAPPKSYQGKKSKVYREKLKKRVGTLKNLSNSKLRTKDKELVVAIILLLGRSYKTTDVDNVAKNIIDGLKVLLFDDDKQIRKLIVEKVPVEKCKHRKLLEMAYVGVAIAPSCVPIRIS